MRNFSSRVHVFWRGVIEWRSPASAPYLMLINIAFWSTALYCSELIQLRVLLSIAAGVVSWDILLSPTHERSIATHVALWPVQSLWRTLSVCGCLYSSHQLRLRQLETACIAAYASVGCLLVNPVWEYYEVNGRIVYGARYCGCKAVDVTKMVIVYPLQWIYRSVKFIVLLQFIPPLWNATKSFVRGIRSGIKNGFSYVVTSIKDFIVGICNGIKNFFKSVGNWISINIIQATKNRICAMGRWLRYWLCAHWWPDLKLWIKVKIGEPTRRGFNYLCYGLVYVFCGYWIPPLRAWLGGWLRCFKDFMMAKMRLIGRFLHRTVVVPTKNFLWRKCEQFRCWLRRSLHRLAVAIRDSILWPICVLVVDVGRELSLLMYRFLLEPILDYLYQRYKVIETTILIYFLGPVCDTIVKNIPEKSPFCDDSDVELEGMLPDEITEEIDQVTSAAAAGSEGEDSLSGIELPSLHDEEERDFYSGLEFPAINNSESSDEEFNLRPRKKPTTARRKRQKSSEVRTDAGAAPEEPTPSLSTTVTASRRRHGAPESFDDEFELLQ